jgi:plasmid stability protein
MEASLPTTLSIKNAPDKIVARLKSRAQRNHRSLQGELMAIIEDAVRAPKRFDAREALAEVRRRGLRTPDEAVAMIRADRDAR